MKVKSFLLQKVPEPHRYFVTHWNSETYIEMTYSYVGVNGSGVDFDNLAESVDEKLYFAGEVRIQLRCDSQICYCYAFLSLMSLTNV